MPNQKIQDQSENLTPPIWSPPPMFDKSELQMIRQVFGQSNFPGNTCAAIGRFIEKCDRLIGSDDSCLYPPGPPMPMNEMEAKEN